MKEEEYKEENELFIQSTHNITTNYCDTFENMGKGVSIFEVIYDEYRKVVDLRVNYINHASILNKLQFRDEIIGKTITELFEADKISLYLEIANKVISTERVARYETFFAQLNKHFLINAIPSHENRCIIIDEDITERKEAEEAIKREAFVASQTAIALKESEKKFRTLFENSNDAIIIIDYKTGKHIDANRKAEEITGYSKEELTSMSAGDLTSENRKKKIIGWFKELNKKNKRIECEILTKDLKQIPVEASATMVEIDGLLYTQVLFKDITERKKAQKELKEAHDKLELKVQERTRELEESNKQLRQEIEERKKAEKRLFKSEQKYRTLFNSSPDYTILVGPDGNLIDVNKAAQEITGLSSQDLIGKNFTELGILLDEEMPLHIEKVSRVLKGEILKPYESKFISDTGEIHHVETYLKPLKKDGEIFAFNVIAHDITERKKAEKALKESETKFRELFNKALDIITLSESQENRLPGQFIEVNEAAIEILGYSKKEFLNMTPIDLFAPESQAEIPQITLELQEKGYTTFEAVSITKDGREFPVEVNVHIFKLGGKEVALALARDITERKKAEKALKENQRTFETLISNLPGVAYKCQNDPQWTMEFVSEGCLELTGYKPEDLIMNKKISYNDLIHPDDRQMVWDTVQKSLKENKAFKLVYRIVTADLKNKFVWEQGRGIFSHEGELIALEGFITDITDSRKTKEEIKRSNRILNGITQIFLKALTVETEEKLGKTCLTVCEKVTGSKFGFICEINNEGTLDTTAISNPGWNECKMPQSDAVKMLNGMEIHGLYGGVVQLEKPVLTNDPTSYPGSVGTPKGHPLIKAYLGFPLKYGDKTIGVIGLANKKRGYTPEDQESVETLSVAIVEALMSFRSRNAVKEYRDQLEETVEELRQSNDELRQFAYITSHDLQEPLRTIASFTQLIERRYKGQLDSDADEYIDFIVDAAMHMKEMIQGLLDYSRVGMKGREFNPTNTEKVLKNVLYNLHATISENNAEITYDKLPVIIASRIQLTQLFQNLIGNAIKFQKPETPPKIHIYARKDEINKEYVFSVADNGIGIEEQYRDKIFKVFKRLHTIDKYKGAGIGLAISKKIIEQHEGRIWVESELGKGSTFHFTVPVKSLNGGQFLKSGIVN